MVSQSPQSQSLGTGDECQCNYCQKVLEVGVSKAFELESVVPSAVSEAGASAPGA